MKKVASNHLLPLRLHLAQLLQTLSQPEPLLPRHGLRFRIPPLNRIKGPFLLLPVLPSNLMKRVGPATTMLGKTTLRHKPAPCSTSPEQTPRQNRLRWLVAFYQYLTWPTAGDKKQAVRLQHAAQMHKLLELPWRR